MSIKVTGSKLATATAIADMLKENTGRHMLDSGGIYGYGYDVRKDVDYPNTPDHYTRNGFYVKSTFHHLLDNLTVDAEENARFARFASQPEHQDEPWSATLDAYCRTMHYTAENAGLTYNTENFLDVDFQWVEVDDKEDFNDRELVVVRSHNGCDIRGGYSAPVWFTYNDNYRDNSNFLSFNVGYLYCSQDSDHRFDSYDACNWAYAEDGVTRVDIETDDAGNFICPTCGGVLQA